MGNKGLDEFMDPSRGWRVIMLTEDPEVVFFLYLLLFAGGSRDTQAG